MSGVDGSTLNINGGGTLTTSAFTDTTNASNITSGTLNNARLPVALTGHTYDGLTNTSLSTGFSIAGGTTSKTLTVDNTLTLAGSDSSTLNIGSGGTLVTSAYTDTTNASNISSGTLNNAQLPTVISGISTYNGLTLLALSTGFSIAGGTTSKTLTVDNNITLAGVDGSTVATLDIATGKLNIDQMPEIAIVSFLGTVNSQAAMTSIGTPPTGLPSGVIGDWCIRSDLGTTWILTGTDQTQFANWLQLSYPPVSVTSVAGRTGVITLSASDIGGLAASATTDTTNASNITSGTLSNSLLPVALTGHTYNGLTNTSLSTGFSIAGGTNSKLLTVDNTLTLAGTDGSTLNISTGGTLVASAFTDTTNASNISTGTLSNTLIPAALTGHTYDGLTNTSLSTGFSIAGGTTSKTLTVVNTMTLAGTDGSTLNISTGGTLVASAFTDTTNATNITSGTLNNSRLPAAFTGISTYNGLTLTALSTGFSVAGGTTSKTLTIDNTLTLAGTDSSTLNISTGGTLVASAFTNTTNATNITSGTLSNSLLPAALTGQTYNGLTNTALSTGFSIAGGTTSKTLTINNTIGLSGTDSTTYNLATLGTNASNITSGLLAVAYGGTDISTVPANGALLIGNGTNYTSATITQGSANQVVVTNAAGSITLSTPQDINTTSAVSFGSVTTTGNFVMSGSSSALANSSKFGNLSRVDISTTIPWGWTDTTNANVTFTYSSTNYDVNCSMGTAYTNPIICLIPPIRQGMRLIYQQIVRADLPTTIVSTYCAFSINGSQSISNVYFGLGSVDYIMTSYPSYVTSTSNYSGIYNNTATTGMFNVMTILFTTTGLTLYQGSNTASFTPATGTAYTGGSFAAGDIIIVSSYNEPSNPPAIRVSVFNVSGTTATLQAEYYPVNLFSGSEIGYDFFCSYIPYLSLTATTSNVNILSERYLFSNIVTWSYGSGTWNFTKSIGFYY